MSEAQWTTLLDETKRLRSKLHWALNALNRVEQDIIRLRDDWDDQQNVLQENERLVEFNYRLMAELAQHGWGDFHYGDQPQDPAIVRLLKEGNFGRSTDTEAPSTDATPPAESDRGTGEWEDTMGRRGSGEVPDGFGVLPPIGGTG